MPVNVTARFFGGGERPERDSGGASSEPAEEGSLGNSYPSHLRPVLVHRMPKLVSNTLIGR